MIYKEKVQNLLEVLNGKLRILEAVTTGAMRLSAEETNRIVKDTQKISDNLSEIISIERN
jgi:putative sterol carrier protein